MRIVNSQFTTALLMHMTYSNRLVWPRQWHTQRVREPNFCFQAELMTSSTNAAKVLLWYMSLVDCSNYFVGNLHRPFVHEGGAEEACTSTCSDWPRLLKTKHTRVNI